MLKKITEIFTEEEIVEAILENCPEDILRKLAVCEEEDEDEEWQEVE